MFKKDKNRRFKIKDKSDSEDGAGIRFKKITKKRPTKNIWVLIALLIVAILIYLYLRGMI